MNLNRLGEALYKREWTQSDLARATGLTQGAINQIISGKTRKSKYAPDIARALGVSLDWLMGEDVPSGIRGTIEKVDFVQLPELDIGYGMGGGTFIEDHADQNPRIFDPTWLREITTSPPEMLFIARGIGDSMMTTLLDNDTLIVDRGQRRLTQQDRVWALTYGDLGMIKRIRRTPKHSFLLMSDNPAISTIEAVEDEINIVGRIAWVGRKM